MADLKLWHSVEALEVNAAFQSLQCSPIAGARARHLRPNAWRVASTLETQMWTALHLAMLQPSGFHDADENAAKRARKNAMLHS